MYDVGTGCTGFYLCGNRNLNCVRKAFVHFAGTTPILEFYSDNARELMAAAEELDWANPTSTPFYSKRNGKAERKLQLMNTERQRL